jgi:hypothetical protein
MFARPNMARDVRFGSLADIRARWAGQTQLDSFRDDEAVWAS